MDNLNLASATTTLNKKKIEWTIHSLKVFATAASKGDKKKVAEDVNEASTIQSEALHDKFSDF